MTVNVVNLTSDAIALGLHALDDDHLRLDLPFDSDSTLPPRTPHRASVRKKKIPNKFQFYNCKLLTMNYHPIAIQNYSASIERMKNKTIEFEIIGNYSQRRIKLWNNLRS